MAIYSHIEERFCTECDRNVGIEYTHMEDGTIIRRCLNKSCGESPESNNCFFKSVEQ